MFCEIENQVRIRMLSYYFTVFFSLVFASYFQALVSSSDAAGGPGIKEIDSPPPDNGREIFMDTNELIYYPGVRISLHDVFLFLVYFIFMFKFQRLVNFSRADIVFLLAIELLAYRKCMLL